MMYIYYDSLSAYALGVRAQGGEPMYQCESDAAVNISKLCDGEQDCPTFGDDEVNLLCPGMRS